MNRPKCARCGREPSGVELAANECLRCAQLKRALFNVVFAPRVAPAEWPSDDVRALISALDKFDYPTEARIVSGWLEARGGAA